MKIIETHCHLDYLKKMELDEVLRLSAEAGVEKLLTISVEPENLDITLELAEKYDNVYCSQGVHPHDAKLITDQDLQKIRSRGESNKKVVAIGEIGLDYHYDHSPRDVQRSFFEKQLEIACQLDLPVIIHTRESDQDTMDILKNHSSSLKRKGVFHSFSSSIPLAEYALSEGFSLGFNGMLTFKAAENVREAFRIAPLGKIMVETDCPFLAPVPHRGRENYPHYLPLIVEKMAEIKQMDVEDLAERIYQNSKQLFSM